MLAKGGKEAIEVYQKNQNKIDLVILDIIMPVTDGGEVFDAIRESNPVEKVLLTSGYNIDGQAKTILERGCDGSAGFKTLNSKKLKHCVLSPFIQLLLSVWHKLCCFQK